MIKRCFEFLYQLKALLHSKFCALLVIFVSNLSRPATLTNKEAKNLLLKITELKEIF